MITQNTNDRIMADIQVVEFTKKHNIHLMAMKPIISLLQDIAEDENIEDIKSGIKTTLYDLDCMDDALHENIDLLWQVKEYHERLTLEKIKRDAKQ
jgi:hypothetical protein